MGGGVYRMTAEQLAAYEARMARMRNGGVKTCPSCNTPANLPHPAECGYKAVADESGASSGINPSPNFVHYFGEAKAVVDQHTHHTRRFRLRLRVPPSVNLNSGPTASGGRYLTDLHKEFRTLVALAVYDHKIAKLYGRLRVTIEVNQPRVDIDNIVKPTLDALQRANAIENDRNVDDLRVMRSESVLLCEMIVEVEEM